MNRDQYTAKQARLHPAPAGTPDVRLVIGIASISRANHPIGAPSFPALRRPDDPVRKVGASFAHR